MLSIHTITEKLGHPFEEFSSAWCARYDRPKRNHPKPPTHVNYLTHGNSSTVSFITNKEELPGLRRAAIQTAANLMHETGKNIIFTRHGNRIQVSASQHAFIRDLTSRLLNQGGSVNVIKDLIKNGSR